ncbi:MAG: type II secretion system F family protein [Desulfovibrionales bacterium]|nr:MAG: type II secretion system F family protein [Desulfovibrionales bacterium]
MPISVFSAAVFCMISEYAYKAANSSGKVLTGVMSADGEQGVALALQRQGYVPLSIASVHAEAPVARSGPGGLLSGKISLRSFSLGAGGGRPKTRDLVMFAENLSVLLRAGIPLNKSLTVLIELTEKKRFQSVIANVAERIREGSSLWQALQAEENAFPPVFINMVRAGEAGGVLDLVLERVAEYLGGIQELKDYLFSAMIYPVILALTALGSIVVMLTVVVPRFAQIFADLGVAMPMATRILLALGAFFQNYWLVLLVGIFGIFLGFRALIQSESGHRNWDALKLRLPLLGPLFKKIEIARFARTLGTLLGSGVSILAAMNIVQGVVMNQMLRSALSDVYEDLKQGRMLSSALQRHAVIPPLAVHLLGVGEETGNMESMLRKLADIYDKETRAAIKSFISLFEPAIILTMGLVIGMMVVSMLLAIFSVNELAM